MIYFGLALGSSTANGDLLSDDACMKIGSFDSHNSFDHEPRNKRITMILYGSLNAGPLDKLDKKEYNLLEFFKIFQLL